MATRAASEGNSPFSRRSSTAQSSWHGERPAPVGQPNRVDDFPRSCSLLSRQFSVHIPSHRQSAAGMHHQPVVWQFLGNLGDNSESLSIGQKELIITAEHPPHFVFETSIGTIAWPSLFFLQSQTTIRNPQRLVQSV